MQKKSKTKFNSETTWYAKLLKDKIQLKLQMYLAHPHIENRNRGAPLDFAGDFNVVTENASFNLWKVRNGLYLL